MSDAGPVREDGSPWAEIEQELCEAKAEIAALKAAMRTISNICADSQWKPQKRWRIRDIARQALGKGMEGTYRD